MCKSYKELLSLVNSLVTKQSRILQNSHSLPQIDAHQIGTTIQTANPFQTFKKENEALKQQISKLEHQIIRMESQFKYYISDTKKKYNEINELKAFKKSIAQYFTSQNNFQSRRSTSIGLSKNENKVTNSANKSYNKSDSRMRSNEEPSPSFLRIMVTDQIIEEEVETPEMENNHALHTEDSLSAIIRTPSPLRS